MTARWPTVVKNKPPELTVIIPARNEERSVGLAVRKVESALGKAADFEIIAVDDCSTDGTGRILDGMAGKRVRVIHRRDAPGFGNALRAGFSAARGTYVVSFMGDLSDEPKDLVKMLEMARAGYDVVIGSRFIKGSGVSGYPKAKLVANRLFNNLLAVLLGVPYLDLTNAFKMYRRELVKKMNIESADFDITVEMPIKALKMEARFAEVPVNWYGRKSGSPKWKLARAGYIYLARLFRTLLFFRA